MELLNNLAGSLFDRGLKPWYTKPWNTFAVNTGEYFASPFPHPALPQKYDHDKNEYVCYGRSQSLDLSSLPEDTDILHEQGLLF